MTTSLKTGTRSSTLAVRQSSDAIVNLNSILDTIQFELVKFSSPGDRDKIADLQTSPADFFSKDLDNAVLNGEIDCAIHSAKDLPFPVTTGLDWVWLPWHQRKEDAIVLPVGQTLAQLPKNPVAGVSSERREEYCKEMFPGTQLKNIRGNIEERLAQLDSGEFDFLIMAGAALLRLGLENRISRWIPAQELQTPEGQGYLAITFKKGNPIFSHLRGLFVKSVTFASAGIGSISNTTVGTINALKHCDVCLYDSLMPDKLTDYLPQDAIKVDVGKRCGKHTMQQTAITDLIAFYARTGQKTVRLKGGDAGLFGRLSEEIEVLNDLGIPYNVLPGISSLTTASTGTGMLLTHRNISRGFCAMTPRKKGGGIADISTVNRAKLPMVFFMSTKIISDIISQLVTDGLSPETPSAIVYGSGSDYEHIIKAPVSKIVDEAIKANTTQPGLFIVGDVTTYSYNHAGPLANKRVLLTCSEALQEKARAIVNDFGGYPVSLPLIKLVLDSDATRIITDINSYDWIIITSPSAARCMMDLISNSHIDLRTLPKIMVCGTGTANEFKKYDIYPDAMPADSFNTSSIIDTIKDKLSGSERILRLRSKKAGSKLSDALKKITPNVDDVILYNNIPITYDRIPEFNCVFFASSSAVEVFIDQWGKDLLKDKIILSIGKPTLTTLENKNIKADVLPPESTVRSTVTTLAEYCVKKNIESIMEKKR